MSDLSGSISCRRAFTFLHELSDVPEFFSHAVELLSGLQKVLYQTGRVILRKTDGSRKDLMAKRLERLRIGSELVEVTHGSPSTVIRFEKPPCLAFFSSHLHGAEDAVYAAVGEV